MKRVFSAFPVPFSGLWRVIVMVAMVAFVVPDAGAQPGPRVIVHYQKNLMFDLADKAAIVDDIRARAPDTVTLQEVSRANRAVLDGLKPDYPSQKLCRFRDIGGVAVASRWPMVEGSARCLEGRGVTAMQVTMPEGPVWVLSVHLETPDQPLHREMVIALAPEIAALAGPKIIGGDFNAFPLSASVRGIARAAGVRRIGPTLTTFRPNPVIGLPIDFVLATGAEGAAVRLPLLGSDHHGVLAEFTMRF